MELKTKESEKELKRKLAIRKIRGREHSLQWLDFSIVEREGIILHHRGRAVRNRKKNR